MAGENQGGGSPVETRVGRERGVSIELGIEGSQDPTKPRVATVHEGRGVTVEHQGGDTGGVLIHETDQPTTVAKPPVAGEEAAKPPVEGEEGAQEKPTGETTEVALPKFDPAKPEVVTAYEKAFFADGKPNLETLSAAWWGSAKRADDGTWHGELPPDAYAFLETKGFPRAMVKEIEAGQVARQAVKEMAVYEMAGGPDKLSGALEWARSAQGYTPAQRQRYMAAINGGDMDAIQEQVTLLMDRHNKATGKGGVDTAARPTRTTATAGGGGGAGGGVAPYANYAEYSADLRAARAKNDQAAYNLARERLKASPWSGLGKAK